MDNFWGKAALAIIIIAGTVVGIGYYMSSRPEPVEQLPKEPPKTISDMREKDKKDILAKPSVKDIQSEGQEVSGPVTLYFVEVDLIEQTEAERQMAMIPAFKTIGRLPMLQYTNMGKTWKLIIERFPGTIYDYKARRALGMVPEQYWVRFKITEEILSLEKFKEQRPGTMAYELEE